MLFHRGRKRIIAHASTFLELVETRHLKFTILALAGFTVSLGAACNPGVQSEGMPFRFALIGDTRYNDEGVEHFANLIDEINSQEGLEWVLHAGDMKGPQTCTDGFFEEVLTEFQKFQAPFIYTPGDNEWTDCHGVGMGSFIPTERLVRLREIFFSQPGMTMGSQPMAVTTQALEPAYGRYVENVRWIKAGITFATIHLVGSGNGLNPWTGIDDEDTFDAPRSERIAEFEDRQDAALAWLDETFEEATRLNSPGVFMMIHANPRFEVEAGDARRAGFNAFLDLLETRTIEFDRSVVLAHGDTHNVRIDKPLTARIGNVSRTVENFTRVETFGNPDTHWIRVSVDPQDREVFKFELMTVEENRRDFAP